MSTSHRFCLIGHNRSVIICIAVLACIWASAKIWQFERQRGTVILPAGRIFLEVNGHLYELFVEGYFKGGSPPVGVSDAFIRVERIRQRRNGDVVGREGLARAWHSSITQGVLVDGAKPPSIDRGFVRVNGPGRLLLEGDSMSTIVLVDEWMPDLGDPVIRWDRTGTRLIVSQSLARENRREVTLGSQGVQIWNAVSWNWLHEFVWFAILLGGVSIIHGIARFVFGGLKPHVSDSVQAQ